MNCRMVRGIYLRANGDINCYCSTGEQILLANIPPYSEGWNFVSDIYNNDKFTHIRESFSKNTLPFPAQCLKCNYLDPYKEYEEDKINSEIEWMHIEPSSACNLRCTFCVHGSATSQTKQHDITRKLISEESYQKILEDIRAAGMNIRWMYFSGRGEPGLHPGLWRMVRLAKKMFDTNFLVNTNGNINFSNDIVDSGLDKIKIALDSLNQDTYRRYRVGGDVNRALDLTRRIAERKKETMSTKPELIWQKVLFDYNDSKEELDHYQQQAKENGVDKLRICYTYTSGYSLSSTQDISNIFPNIEIINNRDRCDIKEEEINRSLTHESSISLNISIIQRIYHWLELGIENRFDYNTYALLPISDIRLYSSRAGHEEFLRRITILFDQFKAISTKYSSSDKESSDKFRQYATSIKQIMDQLASKESSSCRNKMN